MFWRLLYQSFHRQQRSKLLAGIAIALGAAVVTAMLAVVTGVGDDINRELRSFGANIEVYPAGNALLVHVGNLDVKPASATYLKESDLPRIKGIFWRHNILGFSPFLTVNTNLETPERQQDVQLVGTYFSKPLRYGNDNFMTGVSKTHPWWKVRGAWPSDERDDQVLSGAELARELHLDAGANVQVGGRTLQISGILTTGGEQDRQLIAPLRLAQEIAGLPGAVETVYVSALTKPEDSFGRRDPATLSPPDRDRWYCSPYANSIAFQIMEALPGSHAEQIRRVAQSEGAVLSRIEALFLLMCLAAIFAAVLAVAAAMATAMMERRQEIGLMKTLGASSGAIAALFLAEGVFLAALASIFGFALGRLLAAEIGRSVFGAAILARASLFPLILLIAIAIAATGSAISLRRAMRLDPALALKGEAA